MFFGGFLRANIHPPAAAECVVITASTTDEILTKAPNESFTVDAGVISGSTPITYQWQRKYPGGSYLDISGATSSSYTESGGLSLANSGTEYKCNMSNACSTATSRKITVQIIDL